MRRRRVTGSPRSNRAILPATCATASSGTVSPEMCGVTTISGRRQNGWSGGSGSSRKTSSVAPESLPAVEQRDEVVLDQRCAPADVDDVRAVGQPRQRVAIEDALASPASRAARTPGSRDHRETRRGARRPRRLRRHRSCFCRPRVAAHRESLRRQRARDLAADDAEAHHAGPHRRRRTRACCSQRARAAAARRRRCRCTKRSAAAST